MPQRNRPMSAELRDAVAAGFDYDRSNTPDENRERATEEGFLLPELISDADFDSWREEGKRLLFDATAHQWALGEWVVRGEDLKDVANETRNQKFKHAIYGAAADITGLSIYTIKDYAYVARNVPREIRVEGLSFGHHKLVASLSLEQKQRFLTEMQTAKSIVGDARRRIRHVLNQGQPRPKPKNGKDLGAERIIRHCDQLVDSLDSLTASMPAAYWTLVLTVAKVREVLEEIEAASVCTDAAR